jgi:hypothetical protein
MLAHALHRQLHVIREEHDQKSLTMLAEFSPSASKASSTGEYRAIDCGARARMAQ